MVRKATNLKEAYDNLTVTPLKTEEEFQIFHVKRKDSPIADIKKRIEIGRHEKYLFTGLRGSGKSTELNGLVSSLDKDQYFPINYSILENLAPEDFDYKEFFVSLGLKICNVCKDLPSKEKMVKFAKEVSRIGEVEESIGYKVEFFMIKLGREEKTRKFCGKRLKLG